MCLDIGKKGKKKMCEFYLFLVCLQREERERERERENACFYLFARINDVKIHILDHL